MESRFDQEARSWDTAYRAERAEAIAQEIKKQVKFRLTDFVMEFGCGTGLVSMNLLDSVERIAFVDTSEGMLQVVQEKLKKRNFNKPVIATSDLFSPLLPEASFDCIYTSMALHHILKFDEVGPQFYRLLKDGGRLCIVDLNPDDGSFHADDGIFEGHNGFDPEALAQEFTSYGFSREYCSTFYSSIKKTEVMDVPYSLFILVMKKTG